MSIFRKFFGKYPITDTLNRLLKNITQTIIISTLDGFLIYPSRNDDLKLLNLISLARDMINRILRNLNAECRILILEKNHKIIIGYDYHLIFILFAQDLEEGKRKLCELMNKVGDLLYE